MSEIGVPDDDMPRNQTPSWGSLPYDERDLDAVLSGDIDGIAIGLRPVARTLAALRAGPVRPELSGEAAARAAFRAFALASEPAEAPPADAHTLMRPAGAPKSRRRLAAGGAAKGAVGRAVVAAAAVVVVVAAVAGAAVSGVFSGSGRSHGTQPPIAAVTGSAQASGVGSQRVDGRARTVPSPVPSLVPSPGPKLASPAAQASPAPEALDGPAFCRELYSFDPLNKSQSSWRYQVKVFTELSSLAGGPRKIVSYCLAVGLAAPAHPAWPPTGSRTRH